MIPPHIHRDFFNRDTVTVARALLGQLLVRNHPDTKEPIAGIIVETEAYLGVRDKAAHTYNYHRTDRVRTMWGLPGHAYVYFTYGLHHCVNCTTMPESTPQAVLIRALQPTHNLPFIHSMRPKAKSATNLCSGPAKLTQALDIARALDGADLCSDQSPLYIAQVRKRSHSTSKITASPRIGVNYAQEWAKKPLRFHLTGNLHVSRQ
ncbi:DNA-3-methyladenine glycosylase [Poriferisphaera corsica]|nr:DNA-3-methyladenine glycosylase [Poriferisphaera corsica]